MYTLYIGNKNYSSWSLRGWLAVKLSGAPFNEVPVRLLGTFNPANLAFSPTALVPALHDGSTVVWDTLAIGEYLAERHAGMWPADPVARAWARSIVAEMHSGFAAMRNDMAMCIRERLDVRPWSDAVAANIARVEAIWSETRHRFGDWWPVPVRSVLPRRRLLRAGGATASRPTRSSPPVRRAPISRPCWRTRSCANGRRRRWRKRTSSKPTSPDSSTATS